MAGKAPAPTTSAGLLPDLQTTVPAHLNLVNQQQHDYLRFSNGIANAGPGHSLVLLMDHLRYVIPAKCREPLSEPIDHRKSPGTPLGGSERRSGGYVFIRCPVSSPRHGPLDAPCAPLRLGVVLLHSPDPGKQAMQLLDRGWKASSTE